ncbi:MAG TPA: DUF948 domain-containing protein [Dissulfurispiraceae bacterium]|nr:DUF948 domain-containing protein [Dissulfurispiraceae bacterium]
MGGQYWTLLLTTGFFIVIITFLAALFFLIYSSIQIKKMAVAINEFIRTTDNRIKPVLEETELTLKSVRIITDDIGAVTGSVKEVSEAVSDVATNVRAVSMIMGDVREQVSLRTNGVMAGIQAALGVLMKHHK